MERAKTDPKLLLSLAIVVIVVIVLVVLTRTTVLPPRGDPLLSRTQPPAAAAQITDRAAPTPELTHTTTDAERVAAEPPRTEAEPTATPAAELLEGRVIDGAGVPVAGLTVRVEQMDWSARTWSAVPDVPTAVTDALGTFRMRATPDYGRVGATSERYVTVVGAPWPPRVVARESTLVVGERSSYAGLVVDREGQALPGATVVLRVDFAVLTRLFQGEERPLEETWSRVTGAGGEFTTDDIGWMPGTRLVAVLDPFERTEVALEPGVHRNLQIVLELPAGGEHMLHGRVVRADGGSVAGTQVAFAGGEPTASAPDGSFALDLGQDPAPGALLAVLAGFLPAHLELSDPKGASESSRAAPVVLRVESPALAISGEVVDATGAPIPHAWVWTEDGAPFSRTASVEDFAALGTQFPGVGRRAEVDADGKFEISGLLEADYDLHAVHPETFGVVAVSDVSAGSQGVRIVFDDVFPGVRVAGRILYRDGEPAPGVRLYPMLARRHESHLGRPPFLVHYGRKTDAEGYFEFPSLHPAGLRLWVTGDKIGETAQSIEIDLESCADREHIELRVPRVLRFEVVLRGDPDEATSFGAADGAGRLLQLQYILSGSGRSRSGTGPRMKLSAGRSEVLSCSEDVRTLILYHGDEEVRRVPVSLAVGEVTVLEL